MADASRRAWLRTAAAGLAALAISPAALAADDATLRIGYQKYGNFVVLKARGTLEKRLAPLGVNVRWIEFPGGPQLLEGLAAGAVDIGTVGETPPIFAQAGHVDFVHIGAEPPAPRGEAIVVPRDSPIRAVADLRGRKVALNRGSNVHYLLVKALEAAKLDYRDIEPVYLAPADGRAAFEQHAVDAWVIWDPYLAAVERQSGARILRDGEGLVRNTQYYVASRAFASAHPDRVRAVLAEIDATDAWARDHVPEMAAQLAPLVGLDAATLRLALGRASYGVEPITEATLAYQQRIADTFTALKLVPGSLDVTQTRWTAR